MNRGMLGLVCVVAAMSLSCGDDDEEGTNPPTDVVVENFARSACTTFGAVSPVIPDELGHFAAARLTPASYPFTVTKVQYELTEVSVGTCDSTLAHKVEIFVTTAASPTASPSTDSTLKATINVPASASAPDDRTVEHVLATPIELTTGQHIFVSVQLAGNAGSTGAVCLDSCVDAGSGATGEDFWSNATAEPYAWADMTADFGFDIAYSVRVIGHP